MKYTRTLKAIAASALFSLLAACGKGDDAAQQTNAAASAQTTAKTYIVATDPTYAPFEYRDENSQPIGFDIDLIKAIAKTQGFEVTFQSSLWEGCWKK